VVQEERMLASLRKREEEVKQQMAGHLRDRDKERENHQHLEAGSHSSHPETAFFSQCGSATLKVEFLHFCFFFKVIFFLSKKKRRSAQRGK
jgi:hypothetical protein